RADVVVDNFRGGVMERLGLGWETLRGVNPRLVHTSVTGWGSSGPLAARPGFDPIFQACSGLMQAQGGADDPVFHMIAYTDDPAEGAAAAVVARALGGLSRAEALARLAGAGVPAAPCLDFQELFADPLLRAAGCVVEQSHPALGPLLMSGAFIDFEATPVVLRRSAPLLGADGPAALAELGYAPERIAALIDAGVVGRPG